MRPRLSEILRGSVRAEVSGAAPQRLLNAMSEADMPFWDAVPQDAFTIRLGLYSRDLRDAKALATRCQCELKLLRESGAPVVKRRLRRRVALLVTAVSCFALLAASSLFAWDIRVEGNEQVSTGEILRALPAAAWSRGHSGRAGRRTRYATASSWTYRNSPGWA